MLETETISFFLTSYFLIFLFVVFLQRGRDRDISPFLNEETFISSLEKQDNKKKLIDHIIHSSRISEYLEFLNCKDEVEGVIVSRIRLLKSEDEILNFIDILAK